MSVIQKGDVVMQNKDGYSSGRKAYIFEAMFEHFVAVIIAGAFLAKLLTKTGISDSLTGIISSFVSLACVAQLFSVVLIRTTKPVKKWVTALTFIKNFLFVALYMVPMLNVSQTVKTILVVVLILGGQFIANIAVPFKTNWLMSLVDMGQRGVFTAKKEIVSLMGGMAFSYIMGAISDYYTDIGKDNLAFIVCQITILILGILHLAMLVIAKEPEIEDTQPDKITIADMVECTFGNVAVRKLVYLEILWSSFTYLSRSYFGIYEIKELGFSLTYVSVITIVSSFARIFLSKYFGRLADKTSWANMMTICFCIAGAGFFIQTFTIPENGKVFYMIYTVLYSVSLAGLNSGLMNIVFDYTDEKNRTAVLGIKTAVGGVFGFLATIAGGKLLDIIQGNGNTFLGINVYAQQVLSFITFIGIVITVFYMKYVIQKLKRISDQPKF